MVRSETYTLNMGPQHPSTHGVLQVQLELDGERSFISFFCCISFFVYSMRLQ